MSYLDDQAVFTRYICAGNPHTPMITLERLAHDPSAAVRRRVGENPRVSPKILAEFLADPAAEVRLSIADNPECPFSLLQMLSEDQDVEVRYGIAENARIPRDLLTKLAADDNPYVATRATRTLRKLQQPAYTELTANMQIDRQKQEAM